MAEIGKVVGLKCPNCGANLPEDGQDITKCKYCGMTVRIQDAQKYLEYLKGFIVEWMRTALPLGIGPTAASSVDTLARHNIFVYNILPRLTSEFGLIQTNAYELFSKPLIAPPYVKYPYMTRQFGDAKTFFTYDSKIAAIQPFAVSGDDQASVENMGGINLALAHVLVGLDTLEQNKVSAYKLVAENFAEASKALMAQHEILSKRMQALREVYLGMDALCSNNLYDARSRIEQAKVTLEEVKEKSAFDINLSICTGAIEEEIETANTISRIADTMERAGYGDPLSILAQIGKFLEAASSLNNSVSLTWRNRFENLGRYFELSKWFSIILGAKKGTTSIQATGGQGTVLFPFWVADVKYTFGTGALWMKKGVSVTEQAIIVATFPSIQNFAVTPSEVVTDIFSSHPVGSLTSSIVGSETSISMGAQVAGIVQNARPSAAYCKIVPPLSTASEAKQLMEEYLQQVSVHLQGKMQIASCDVNNLVFVPADFGPGYLNFNRSLGYLQPRRVGEIQVINDLLV